ncbi:MAG: hypothetical protein PHU46_13115 [Rhodocyclaceae bacterium]|nr:hypothetical protein [Rhodocyclaceae bacterium]
MKKLSLCALGLVSAASLLPGQALATYVELLPTFDQVYLHDHWPGGSWNRWDTNPNPNITYYSYYYDPGFGSSASVYNTSLSFDLGAITPGRVLSARLYLDLLSASGDGAAGVNISGLDNLLTHTLGWTTVDVTSLLPVAGGTLNLSTAVTDPNHGGVSVSFGSPAGGLSPYLRVDFVPEPATSWLLVIASISLMTLGRKTRAIA